MEYSWPCRLAPECRNTILSMVPSEGPFPTNTKKDRKGNNVLWKERRTSSEFSVSAPSLVQSGVCATSDLIAAFQCPVPESFVKPYKCEGDLHTPPAESVAAAKADKTKRRTAVGKPRKEPLRVVTRLQHNYSHGKAAAMDRSELGRDKSGSSRRGNERCNCTALGRREGTRLQVAS